MQKMIFDKKQQEITLYKLDSGATDVMIAVNEREVSEEGIVSYEYDGNLFRTYKDLTEDEIKADLEFYFAYEGDEQPTDEMIQYAAEMIDDYTMQLIEEGLL